MRQIKKSVRKFWVEYNLCEKSLALDVLSEIINTQGFKIVFFDITNPPDVQALIETLELHGLCKDRNGFTYYDNNIKLVFVRRSLNNSDKFAVLLHEEGHIYLEHFFRTGNLRDTSVQHENEANAFALLIMRKMKKNKMPHFIKALLYFVSLTLTLSLSTLLIHKMLPPAVVINPVIKDATFSSSPSSQAKPSVSDSSEPQTDIHTYYWTQHGTVYHIYLDCQHLKNSNSVQSGPQNDSGKERCCKTCYSRYLYEFYGDSSTELTFSN